MISLVKEKILLPVILEGREEVNLSKALLVDYRVKSCAMARDALESDCLGLNGGWRGGRSRGRGLVFANAYRACTVL